MMVVKALSGIAAVVFEIVVIIPICIFVVNVLGFRPVWDG